MADFRVDYALRLIALLALAWSGPALAQNPAAPPPPTGLYDRPVLALDPGVHTAAIFSAAVDAEGRYAVTGSDDKTVRVWSTKDGRPLRTIRLPAGPGHLGRVYAVAISPDGEVIAAGGWTRSIEKDPQEQIYLFDRATGTMVRRIDGLRARVTHLTFSHDGRYLAAMVGATGLRVYDRYDAWTEVARDTDYADKSYGADFSTDGWLATTSHDGRVRLYNENFELIASTETGGGEQSFRIAFSPDGSKLAVGYMDSTAVDLLDGHTLTALPGPDTEGIDNGDLSDVAWSANGRTLFAGGLYNRAGIHPVVAWAEAGAGTRRELPASEISTLAPLPNGSLLVAGTDPYIAVLDPEGNERWAQPPVQADFRGQDSLAVSADGSVVDFGYGWGETPGRYELATLHLSLDPPADRLTAKPEQTKLPVENWEYHEHPTLAGTPLPLDRYEISRSLAIHPKGDRFVLGTEWWLRAYDAGGELIWRQAAPGIVSAVNISGDGRLVVAAYEDGTIRWHRMDDGRELLAFLPLKDRKNWVAWTPDGFYAATPGAHGVLRWHVNLGWDAPGEAIPVSDIAELRRPEVLPLVL
jgi:WD40 repeat protein